MTNFFFFISSLFILSNAQSSSFQFKENFLFGISSAPAQIEDQIEDPWILAGRAGKIAGFNQTPKAEERNQFWSDPSIEIDQLTELGVEVYRMGIDWQRIYPEKNVVDEVAIFHYLDIIKAIKSKNIKLMITLFHHSAPTWVIAQGGWTNPETQEDFLIFCKTVVEKFSPYVDYWITFNEPKIYLLASHYLGIWPNNGKTYSFLSLIDFPFWKGQLAVAETRMAESHEKLYKFIHFINPMSKVGVAQNFASYQGSNRLGKMVSSFAHSWMNFSFTDQLINFDFMGVNYYGAEVIKNFSWFISPQYEYSDSGRAISPMGLYHLLHEIKTRYQLTEIKPIIITENGIADATDKYRETYLLEHLVAIHQAIKEGIPISGYLFWTLMDNMEWSDGYCPKFGLIDVRRDGAKLNFIRRDSFTLYQNVIKYRTFFDEDRKKAEDKLKHSIGATRPFCRSQDGYSGLASPEQIPMKPISFHFQENTLQK